MGVVTTRQASKTLVGQVKKRLAISIILLLALLFFRVALSIYTSLSQNALDAQHTTIRHDISDIFTSMVDQETGLRGYIITHNPLFLEPFDRGRPQYLYYVQDLQALINNSDFTSTRSALTNTTGAAERWYTTYAQVQITNMNIGHAAIVRSDSMIATGKALFDTFRSSMTRLQNTADSDLNVLQNRVNTTNLLAIAISTALSFGVILLLWYMFTRFAGTLHNQLTSLTDSILRLARGDLSARVQPLAGKELNVMGQTLNSMAERIQEQQKALGERDVLESVQQLNTVLNQSLDFDNLVREFLDNVLILLGLQLAAFYLYDAQRQVLILSAARGFNKKDMQQEVALGEGMMGMTAEKRIPLHLIRPADDAVAGMRATTLFGLVLPTSIYHLPLLRGDELIGVLSVGSIYSLKEHTRHVLNVVADSLSAAISNARAYQHIRAQTEELTQRALGQERSNIELRQQRDELAVLNSALEEANRVRSQFLSTMTHELRTPLAAIIGFGQMVLRDLEQIPDTQRQRNNMERILKNGKHLLTLINGVLDLAKIDAGRMNLIYSQVDVRALLNSVVEETQSIAFEQKLSVRVIVEEGIGSIETDQVKLRQILLNLISNAFKFTPKGEVIVSARSITGSSEADERVALSVTDTGIGIAPELQERIFEAFFQADSSMTRKFGGTGLGLSIVRQLTTLLEGTLEMQSQPEQGSTFTITLPVRPTRHNTDFEPELFLGLPASDAPLEAVASSTQLTPTPVTQSTPAPPQPAEPAHQRSVVLVVDDNQNTVNVITSALENSPFQVIGIQDPLKVLETVQKLHPCAITLDIMMPDLNGWQLLYHLKSSEETASIPVIVLTVLAERTTGYVLGTDDYMVKPFERDTLLKTLYRLTATRATTRVR